MNELSETWSLPWHTLQRNLALGINADAAAHSTPSLMAHSVQGMTVTANSWLSRARRRAPSALYPLRAPARPLL